MSIEDFIPKKKKEGKGSLPYISFGLPEELYDKIIQRCVHLNCNRSAYMRALVMQDLEKGDR